MRYAYLTRLFASLAETIFLPFSSLWLLSSHILSIADIGVITSTCLIMTRVGATFLHEKVNLYPKKYIAAMSLCCIIVVYAMLFFLTWNNVHIFILWWVLSFLLGLAISLGGLSLVSLVPLITKEKDHLMGFSHMNLAVNVSAGLGPLLGAAVLTHIPQYLPLVPIAFAIFALFSCIKVPLDKPRIYTLQQQQGFAKKNFKWMALFMFINFLTFMGYSQFYHVFPVYAAKYISKELIGVLFACSSAVIILMQVPMARFVSKINITTALIYSNVFLALGTMLLALIMHNLLILCILGVVMVSMAEIAYGSLYETLAVKIAKANPVKCLAMLNCSWGIAEAVANFMGIYLVTSSMGFHSYMMGVLAALGASALLFVKYRPAKRIAKSLENQAIIR